MFLNIHITMSHLPTFNQLILIKKIVFKLFVRKLIIDFRGQNKTNLDFLDFHILYTLNINKLSKPKMSKFCVRTFKKISAALAGMQKLTLAIL